MKAYTVIHWVLISLLVMAVAACTSENFLEKASTALEDQRYEDAKKYARQYAMANSNSFKAHMILGKAFMNSSASDSDDDIFTARYYFKEAEEIARNASNQSDDWKKKRKREAQQGYIMAKNKGNSKNASKELLDMMEKDLLAGDYALVYETSEFFTKNKTRFYDEASLTNTTALFLDGKFDKCKSDLESFKSSGNTANHKVRKLKQDFIRRTLNYLEQVSTGSKNTGKLLDKLQGEYGHEQIKDKEVLLYARAWEILGKAAEDNDLKKQAKTSYKEAKKLYKKAEQDDKAHQMKNRIDSLEDSAGSVIPLFHRELADA